MIKINKKLNNIYNEDCIEFMRTLPNESVDLIIADPPYYKIHGEFDFIWNTVDEYIDWCKQWILECKRILKPIGSFYMWGKIGFNNGYPMFKLADWIENNKLFVVRNWITQRNTRGRGNKKGYMEAREELLFMTKSDNYIWNPAYTKDKSIRKDLGADGKPRKNEFKRCSDVWIDITEASQSSKQRFKLKDGTNFPTVKAQRLCDRIIQASSDISDIVYIPFAGSGSEIESCTNNNRNWIATEINKEYIDDIIMPRLSKINSKEESMK
jgi:site-specific DNA-methyltransferase (adenine-specific)